MDARIVSVSLGRIAPFRGADEPSAIDKHPVTGPVAVTYLGLAGDEQADPVHHGGPDKALHHYPREHYAHWRAFLGDHSLLLGEAAMGENLATLGLEEEAVCLGDRFRLGSALVEISQGRQPCWKLGHRFGDPRVTAEVVRTGKSGWYYRVIEAGTVAAGDQLSLLDRPLPDWSVARVFALLVGGGHRADRAAVAELERKTVLAEAWRQRARQLLG